MLLDATHNNYWLFVLSSDRVLSTQKARWQYPIHFIFTSNSFSLDSQHYNKPTSSSACIFTFPPVLSHSCLFPKVLQYQSTHRSFHTRTSLGARSFSVASLKIWNLLPPALHSCNCPDTFHRHLKTQYFQQAFSSSLGTSLLAPLIWHLLTLCAFINFIC